MHRDTVKWFENIVAYQFFIDSIERGEPSEWLLRLMKIIHKNNIGKEKVGNKNVVGFLKELRSKTAKKLFEELENPTIEIDK